MRKMILGLLFLAAPALAQTPTPDVDDVWVPATPVPVSSNVTAKYRIIQDTHLAPKVDAVGNRTDDWAIFVRVLHLNASDQCVTKPGGDCLTTDCWIRGDTAATQLKALKTWNFSTGDNYNVKLLKVLQNKGCLAAGAAGNVTIPPAPVEP